MGLPVKWQWVRYRSAFCLARFMEGRKTRAIWMQFEDENGCLSKQRLILSTLSDLIEPELLPDKQFAPEYQIYFISENNIAGHCSPPS
jgi:hypothetical protein